MIAAFRLLLVSVILLSSCKRERCYVCKSNTRDYPDTILYEKTQTICGMTKDDKKATEEANSYRIIGVDGFTYQGYMHCD